MTTSHAEAYDYGNDPVLNYLAVEFKTGRLHIKTYELCQQLDGDPDEKERHVQWLHDLGFIKRVRLLEMDECCTAIRGLLGTRSGASERAICEQVHSVLREKERESPGFTAIGMADLERHSSLFDDIYFPQENRAHYLYRILRLFGLVSGHYPLPESGPWQLATLQLGWVLHAEHLDTLLARDAATGAQTQSALENDENGFSRRLARLYVDVPWYNADPRPNEDVLVRLVALKKSARRRDRAVLEARIFEASQERLQAARNAVGEHSAQLWKSEGGGIMGQVLAAAERCAGATANAAVESGAANEPTCSFINADFRAFVAELSKPWPALEREASHCCDKHEARVQHLVVRIRAEHRPRESLLQRWKRTIEDNPVGAVVLLVFGGVAGMLGFWSAIRGLMK